MFLPAPWSNSQAGKPVLIFSCDSLRISLVKSLLFVYFLRARVCWSLLFFCRPFSIFERCLDSNPESCLRKQARDQLSHLSPPLSHPSPISPTYPSHLSHLATHLLHLATHLHPLSTNLLHLATYLPQLATYLPTYPLSPPLSHPSPPRSHPSAPFSHPSPHLATHLPHIATHLPHLAFHLPRLATLLPLFLIPFGSPPLVLHPFHASYTSSNFPRSLKKIIFFST